MYKVFGSGTCRLLQTLNNGTHNLNPIHTFQGHHFNGINFMGKQKNSRNHIQFLKYIKKEIELPEDIKNDFFSAFHDKYPISQRPNDAHKNIENLRNEFETCDVFLFEIASIKIQMRGEYCVSDENTRDFTQFVLTKEEITADLEEIIRMAGLNKKIIFLNHLRLQEFEGGPRIENREIVYTTIHEICKKYENVYQYDPTLMIKTKLDYQRYFGDPWHYTQEGILLNFQHLYSLINQIMNHTKIESVFINSNTNIKEILYDSDDEDALYHKKNHNS